ncbi:MAG: hypothetical protein U0W24_01185 [Bacteroidales bacterium]
MSIEIKEVKTKADLKTFIHLPEKIHKDHKNWLPPILMDEWTFFSAKKNSLFSHNDTILLLAFDDNKAVGRVMGIVPHNYNKTYQLKNARFSFMECYNDKAIFDALIGYIEKWASGKNCNEVIGPMAFSDKEPQGFLISGFDDETMLVTNCSFPYMVDFISQNGYEPHVDLCEYEVPLLPDTPEKFKPFAERVARNNHIVVKEFKSTRAVRPYIVPAFDLINKTYQDIYGFSALTEREANEFSNRFLPLLDPSLIKIILKPDGELLAFIVAMADLSHGIRKARGRLLPFGWYHILKSGRKSKRLLLLLGAVAKEVRNKGLDAILGYYLLTSAIKKGFNILDSHLIMRKNVLMRNEIERLENFKIYKEYRIFRKKIE